MFVIPKEYLHKVWKLRIIEDSCFLQSFSNLRHKRYFLTRDQLLGWFFPQDMSYQIVAVTEPADICLCSVRLSDHRLLRKNECNILISIENCPRWPWFPHYNTYGNYGNPMIDIYIYHHLDRIHMSSNFLAIPTIYFRMQYVESLHDRIRVSPVPFAEKKFVLVINRSQLNPLIAVATQQLSKYGQVDDISMYTDSLKDSSCYHSQELLQLFQSYQFILTFENSRQHGYVTEKIMNVFLAGSIPIYWGAPDIERYINPSAFLHYDSSGQFLQQVDILRGNHILYDQMVQSPKRNPSYDNEHFHKIYTDFFFTKLIINTKKKETIR